MTIKSIFFCLFLYICLVWTGAAYLEAGPNVEKFGLLWTAGGLLAALAIIVLGRVWTYWGALRTKLTRAPKTAVPQAVVAHEDETAVRLLLAEANTSLQKSGAYAARGTGFSLSRLPLYLLVGSEDAGKTSTFINSGLEPQLLAGRVAGAGPLLPTQLCNIWFAKNSIFVEISGRIFADPVRWERILRALRSKPIVPLWRRLWQKPEPDVSLQGAAAFLEAKEFLAATTPQGRERIERRAQDWQERLRVVAEVFNRAFPVYVLVAKADGIPYFSDYFRRLADAEVREALGCTLALPIYSESSAADVEAKRLTRSFGPFYRALAERRLVHLAHEPDASRRPGIYEFPRELKRLRSPLVQFLVDVFRPHPLRLGPVLRGYYFTGTREGEALPSAARSGSIALDEGSMVDATILFRGDATQIFRPDDASRVAMTSAASRGPRRWLFASDLFEKIILGDHFVGAVRLRDSRDLRRRKLVLASVCGLCLLVLVAALSSWSGNSRLLAGVRSAATLQPSSQDTSLAELQSLDDLRMQLSQLTANERDGAPLHLRWGLYSGNDVLPALKRVYFHRFQEVLLNNLNGAIVGRLSLLRAVPGPSDPYEPAFSLLKTHLMISSGSCKSEPELVSKVLREALAQIQPEAGDEWRSLAAKQIDFYASELPFGNPCHLSENVAARNRAREYLQHIQGADRLYARILASGRKRFAKPLKLADLAPNFGQALNGQPEVDGVFSKDGWTFVDESADKDSGAPTAESCVTGEAQGYLDPSTRGVAMRRLIQQLYVHDYIERWRSFVTSFSVARYSSAADAARKLEVLADHKSPLLAVFALTSNQTNFPATAEELSAFQKVRPMIKKLLPGLSALPKGADFNPARSDVPVGASAAITGSFQPVHAVVPPGSQTWVVEKNSAYLDSLAELGRSMQAIAEGGGTADPALHQAASQSYEKAIESARQIAKGFEPMGVDGLDVAVQHLLEAPILMVQPYTHDPDITAKQKVNIDLKSFSARLRPLLHKYPFSQSGEDATLEEVSAWFAPGAGDIWRFQAKSLADLTIKDGSSWKAKESGKKMQVTPELLAFLNRAQAITDAFYANGSAQAQLSYILRPKLDVSFKDAVIELEVDGQKHEWTSTLQKQFTWPAPPASKDMGARGRIRTTSLAFPFTSRGGVWGIFHAVGDAEPRALGSKVVEWKYVRGGDGRLEPIQPAPVRLEFVEFPGGADLFNPQFYNGLQCPSTAAQ